MNINKKRSAKRTWKYLTLCLSLLVVTPFMVATNSDAQIAKAETRQVTITTDLGYDVTNSSNITGDWTGQVDGTYYSATSNQALNGVVYSSVTSLKMVNNNYLEYSLPYYAGVTSINATIYSRFNTTVVSASAIYSLSVYDESNETIGTSTSTEVAKEKFSGGYSTITSGNLAASPATASCTSMNSKEIAKIKLSLSALNATAGVSISRIVLTYTEQVPAWDEFSNLQTKASMKVRYSYRNSTYTFDNNDTAIRFGAEFSSALYNDLSAIGATEWGTIAAKSSSLNGSKLTIDNGSIFNKTIVQLDSNYQLSAIINQIDAVDYDESYTATCYVKIGTAYYYMKSVEYSLSTLAVKYVENYESEISGSDSYAPYMGALRYIASFAPTTPVNKKVQVYFIDLEGSPGDCALIQIENTQILVDAGENASTDKANVLAALGEIMGDDMSLEYVVATHPHSDHIGGLPVVFSNYEIGSIFKYQTSCSSKTNLMTELDNAIESETGCQVNLIHDYLNGQTSKTLTINDDVDLVFYDTGSLLSADENNSSIVFTLEACGSRLLFTGDAEKNQEAVYASLCGDVDVFSMGHHGSANGTSASFLSTISPEVCIAQIGDYLGNKYSHPTFSAMQRVYDNNINTKIYATAGGNGAGSDKTLDRNGMLTIEIFADHYVISSEFGANNPIEMRDTTYWLSHNS